MARLINNSWVAATPPAGKTITNYSLENNGVQVIEVGNVLVANGVSVGDEAINTRVRAKYNDGTYGPYSNVVTIAAVSAPAAPTNLAAGTPTDTTIPLTWTKSTTGVMTAYRVYHNSTLIQTFTGDVAAGTVTGLTAGTSYTLYVRAYNGTTESANSIGITVSTAAAAGGWVDVDTTNATVYSTTTYATTPYKKFVFASDYPSVVYNNVFSGAFNVRRGMRSNLNGQSVFGFKLDTSTGQPSIGYVAIRDNTAAIGTLSSSLNSTINFDAGLTTVTYAEGNYLRLSRASASASILLHYFNGTTETLIHTFAPSNNPLYLHFTAQSGREIHIPQVEV